MTVSTMVDDLTGRARAKAALQHAVKESRDGLAVVGLLVACWCVAVEFFVGVFVTVKALLP